MDFSELSRLSVGLLQALWNSCPLTVWTLESSSSQPMGLPFMEVTEDLRKIQIIYIMIYFVTFQICKNNSYELPRKIIL